MADEVQEADDVEMTEEDKLQVEMKQRLADARAKKAADDAKKKAEEVVRRKERVEKERIAAEEKAKLTAEKKARSEAKEAARAKTAAANQAATEKFHADQEATAAAARKKAQDVDKQRQMERFKREQRLQFQRGNRKKSAGPDYNWARDQGFITNDALLLKAKQLEGSAAKIKEVKEGGMKKGELGKDGDIAVLKDPDGKLIIRDDLLKQMESGKHAGSKTKKKKGISEMFRRGSSLIGVRVQKDELEALSSQKKLELQQKKLELKTKRKAKMALFSASVRKKDDMGIGGLVGGLKEKQKMTVAAMVDGEEEEEKDEQDDEVDVTRKMAAAMGLMGDEAGGDGYDGEDEGEEEEEEGGDSDADIERELEGSEDEGEAYTFTPLQPPWIQQQQQPEEDEDGSGSNYSELGEEDAIGDWFNRDQEWIQALTHDQRVDAMVELESTHHSCRLQLQIHRADGLPKTDLFGGKNDVYCIVYWMDKEIGRTAIIQDTLTPEWPFEVFEMLLPDDISLGRLRIEVYDDDFGKDDFLGMVELNGEELLRVGMKRRASAYVPIDDGSDGRGRGGQQEMQLGIIPDKKGTAAMKYVKEGGTITISQGRWRKLQLHLLRAHGLHPQGGKGNDVYCLVFVDGHQVHKTKRVDNTTDANWADGSEQVPVFLPDDPELLAAREVKVEVWDEDLGKDDFLGEVILTGAQMCEMLDNQKDEHREKKKARKAAKKARRGKGMASALAAEAAEAAEEEEDPDAHLEVVKPFVLQKKASVKAKKQKHVKGLLTMAWVDDTPTLGNDLSHRLHAVRHGATVLRQAGVTRVGIQIHGASDLAITDMGSAHRSRADAYCLVYWDNHDGGKTSLQLKGRTATIPDSLHPIYENEYFEVEVPVLLSKVSTLSESASARCLGITSIVSATASPPSLSNLSSPSTHPLLTLYAHTHPSSR
jgi:hypothetical protein